MRPEYPSKLIIASFFTQKPPVKLKARQLFASDDKHPKFIFKSHSKHGEGLGITEYDPMEK